MLLPRLLPPGRYAPKYNDGDRKHTRLLPAKPILRFNPTVRFLPLALASAVSVLSLPFAAPAAQAQTTTTITFDAGDPIGGLPVGATLGSQYAAFGVTFSPNAFTGAGGPNGNWATNTNVGIVSSTGSDVGSRGTPSLVSGNLLRSFNGWLVEDGDPSFRANFSTPITTLSADFAGIATPSSTRLFAYNGTTLLATVIATTTGQQSLTISSVTPITSVFFTPGDFSDWVGVDNISFTRAAINTAAPEPGSLALLLPVMGTVGMVIRKRRKN